MAVTTALLVAGLFAMLISAIPFYGYRVIANEFDQWVFLVFLGAWGLTVFLAIGGLIGAVVWRKALGYNIILLIFFAVLLLASAGFGLGGIRRAFIEMVAG